MKTEDTAYRAPAREPLGLYIHYPFCLERCAYCDFLTFPHAEAMHALYLATVKEEITLLGEAEKRHQAPFGRASYGVDSVYFGGGTPSLMPPEALASILDALRTQFSFADDVEITMEANPGTLHAEGLARLLSAGVSRISLGVQTMSDTLLNRIGRTHTSRDVERDMAFLQEAGVANINVDFILGLPGQTRDDIHHDLSCIAQWRPQHVSWYSLILEEKTLFAWQAKHGELVLPEEDLLLQEEEDVLSGLSVLGYERYEISNFALPSFASRHNLKYWTAQDYLGIGVGAASYLQRERYQNPSGIHAYEKVIHEGRLPQELVPRLPEDDCFEQVMMGLRKIRGIDRQAFFARNGLDVLSMAPKSIAKAQENGLLQVTPARIAFTRSGLNVQNDVLSDILGEWEE